VLLLFLVVCVQSLGLAGRGPTKKGRPDR